MKSAKEILQSAFVCDTHLDLLHDLAKKHAEGRKNVIMEDYMETFKQGGVNLVFAAIFVDSDYLPEQGLRRAMDQIASLYHEFDQSNGAFVIAKSVDDILRARDEGKVAFLIAFEGIEPLNGDIGLLRLFYEMGVRVCGLCWSRSNWAADGCRFFSEGGGYGLTIEGRELVERAQELGMLIDVSHTNIPSFWDVLHMTKKPVIATHSNARAVADTPRNLHDDQIRALHECGGVMGLNGASLIVNAADPMKASMDDLVRHLSHEKEVGTAEVFCIGLDQCDRIESSTLTGELSKVFDVIPTHDKLEVLVDALINAGFTEDELVALLGGNVLRVLKATIG